ncbi:hypothetical protein Y032_0392g586 [Ancylostoma ceylanicum]|uniref:Secreted protein n=1 Tax=Ancylostoma ceylanicum TaxID=53326 RepID=A0A016RRV4_9BILA|nr:hypothetical protein Y032_0392g586 [Ancylostoma ceylanicum]
MLPFLYITLFAVFINDVTSSVDSSEKLTKSITKEFKVSFAFSILSCIRREFNGNFYECLPHQFPIELSKNGGLEK